MPRPSFYAGGLKDAGSRPSMGRSDSSALMKLHFKFMWERFATAIKIDGIPLFDVRRSLVSGLDQSGCPFAGGRARVKLQGITNDEYRMSKGGIASLSHFFIK